MPTGASGQSYRLEADASASRITYEGLTPLGAGSVSLLGEYSRRALFGRVRTSWTGLEGGASSLQGSASLAGWTAPFGRLSPVRLELGGSLTGSRHSSDFDARVALLESRLHALGRRGGAWIGMGVANARNSYDSTTVSAWLPAAGVWLQGGDMRASMSYRHTRFGGQSYPEVSGSVVMSRGRADLAVYGGVREWPGDDGLGDELWAGASAAFWVTSRAAVTISGASYAWDVLQGLSGGEYLSIGIRLTPRRIRPVPVEAPAPLVFTIEEVRAGAISFELVGARSVEIAGDWTDWRAVPLVQGVSGTWTLPTDLEPGAYRFNLRIDGERWMVPDGFPTLDDGFGGSVGLLIVTAPGSGL